MTPHYLDRDWRYHGAASHANAGAFARRQQQRRREAQDAKKTAAANAAEAAAKVQPLPRRAAR